jgi:hypothetical protein
MKHFFKKLVFLICFFSSIGLSVAHASNSTFPYQNKLYFDSSDLEISDKVFYIHLENNLFETNTIRTDENGFYILENDITDCRKEREKMWKCPYCHHWWPIGLKCQNPDCPTNKW